MEQTASGWSVYYSERDRMSRERPFAGEEASRHIPVSALSGCMAEVPRHCCSRLALQDQLEFFSQDHSLGVGGVAPGRAGTWLWQLVVRCRGTRVLQPYRVRGLHPPGRPEPSRAGELRAAGTEVLVVNGDRDPFGIPAARDASQVVVLPGESHSLSKRPAAVGGAVGRWLDGHAGLASRR